MALNKLPYRSLGSLVRRYLSSKEDEKVSVLIEQLRAARNRGYLTRVELVSVCRWKSPRALKLIRRNKAVRVCDATRRALATRSERKRLQALTELHGVSVPMASAILTLLHPQRYGVIDIRVWQVMHELGAVTKRPSGVGFNFRNWYQFLMIIRHLAGRFGVAARDVERTLFLAHKDYQRGRLYAGKQVVVRDRVL